MAELKTPTLQSPSNEAGSKPSPSPASKMTGRQKAAILLGTLGPERAATLFGHMRDDEIESLTLEMAKLAAVEAEVTEAGVSEAVETAGAMSYVGAGGFEFAREVLEKSLGAGRAAEI